MAKKAKSKLEELWQDFEKSGSVESYLLYQQLKLKAAASAKKPAAKVLAKSRR